MEIVAATEKKREGHAEYFAKGAVNAFWTLVHCLTLVLIGLLSKWTGFFQLWELPEPSIRQLIGIVFIYGLLFSRNYV
jgi:hypothetical protein